MVVRFVGVFRYFLCVVAVNNYSLLPRLICSADFFLLLFVDVNNDDDVFNLYLSVNDMLSEKCRMLFRKLIDFDIGVCQSFIHGVIHKHSIIDVLKFAVEKNKII